MIKTILWDFDNTLLDFNIAEKTAIISTFKKLNLGTCSNKMLEEYIKINLSYWQKIEKNLINKKDALIKRFADFFSLYNIDKNIAETFNNEYALALGDTIVYIDNSFELIKSLNKKYKQYIVTNGDRRVQNLRIKNSKFDKLVDKYFISDNIGAEKPNIEFFNYVLNYIEFVDKSEIIIVGDSLTSDIKGGNNAGIPTCWYNPNKKTASSEYKINYEIQNLNDILNIV